MKAFILTTHDLSGVSDHYDYLADSQVFRSFSEAKDALLEWLEEFCEMGGSSFQEYYQEMNGTATYVDPEAMVYASITEHTL